MKKYLKFLFIFVLSLFVFGLTACGDKEKGNNDQTKSVELSTDEIYTVLGNAVTDITKEFSQVSLDVTLKGTAQVAFGETEDGNLDLQNCIVDGKLCTVDGKLYVATQIKDGFVAASFEKGYVNLDDEKFFEVEMYLTEEVEAESQFIALFGDTTDYLYHELDKPVLFEMPEIDEDMVASIVELLKEQAIPFKGTKNGNVTTITLDINSETIKKIYSVEQFLFSGSYPDEDTLALIDESTNINNAKLELKLEGTSKLSLTLIVNGNSNALQGFGDLNLELTAVISFTDVVVNIDENRIQEIKRLYDEQNTIEDEQLLKDLADVLTLSEQQQLKISGEGGYTIQVNVDPYNKQVEIIYGNNDTHVILQQFYYEENEPTYFVYYISSVDSYVCVQTDYNSTLMSFREQFFPFIELSDEYTVQRLSEREYSITFKVEKDGEESEVEVILTYGYNNELAAVQFVESNTFVEVYHNYYEIPELVNPTSAYYDLQMILSLDFAGKLNISSSNYGCTIYIDRYENILEFISEDSDVLVKKVDGVSYAFEMNENGEFEEVDIETIGFNSFEEAVEKLCDLIFPINELPEVYEAALVDFNSVKFTFYVVRGAEEPVKTVNATVTYNDGQIQSIYFNETDITILISFDDQIEFPEV